MLTIEQYHEYRGDQFKDQYYGILPKTCDYCKHPIIISYEKTIMKCSNRSCPKHMSYRAEIMFKDLGVKDIGAQTAFKMIIENKLVNHMDILGLTQSQMPANNSDDVRRRMFLELQKGRRQTVDKILRMYQLDDVADQTSSKIMSGFSSFEDFFNQNNNLETMVNHVVKSLGMSERTYRVLKIAYHLLGSADDLKRIQKYFEVVSLSGTIIPVCITGSVLTAHMEGRTFSPREKFIEVMNQKYEGIVSFKIVANPANALFLCTDSTKLTPKLRKAISRNSDGKTRIQITTFKSFVQSIEQIYGTGDENIKISLR